ncbi:MAG: RNA 2',3'-cyclic phosphodiesterase [Gammaproteobacteria bacterium]|nr:RNA 2',3'-cyclic phosphodiesterase [Gammaproteobacteria bacterium]
MRDSKDIRIFFALWPQDALRERLHRASQTIPVEPPARRVPRHNLHLTLHFIGNVYFDRLTCLRQQARQVKAEAFDLNIDCQGYFKKPRVAWLGCRETPAALRDLHRQLGQRLRLCDYQPETRKYNPHVTLARKIEFITEQESFAAIVWKVESFSLVEVRQIEKGVQYRVIEDYALR